MVDEMVDDGWWDDGKWWGEIIWFKKRFFILLVYLPSLLSTISSLSSLSLNGPLVHKDWIVAKKPKKMSFDHSGKKLNSNS